MRRAVTATVALVLASGAVQAQPRLVQIRGVAWDSLRSEPLAGAMISVTGTGRSVAADAKGRFHVDSIAPGAYTVVMSHDAIDSLGLPGIARRVEVTDGREEVRLALPSFATFWRAGCAGRPPRDSSLVYGVVRTPGTGAPVRGATVELAWLEIGGRDKRDVRERMRRLEVRSDSVGNFGFCGVPAGQGFRMRATSEPAMSGIIDMMPNPDRVRWRDLSVGAGVAQGGATGVVSGAVVRGTGIPFADARVVIDDVGETRTDSAGRFSVAGVPAGTRQLQILAVGLDPITRAVDVPPNDSARVNVNLDRVTTLGSVRVSAATPFTAHLVAGITERRSQGLGKFADSTAFVGMSPWIKSALQSLPYLTVRDTATFMSGLRSRPNQTIRMRNNCTPAVWLDGVLQSDHEAIWGLNTEDLALVEMYPSRAELPVEFQGPRRASCAVVIWTKRLFRR